MSYNVTPYYQAGNIVASAMNTTGYGEPSGNVLKRKYADVAAQAGRAAKAVLCKDQAGYIQRVKAKRRDGRRVSRRSKAVKMIAAARTYVIDRWQKLTKGTAAEGSETVTLPFPLSYVKGADDAATNAYPVYCVDLTSIGQRISPSSDTWHFPNVMYRLIRERAIAGSTELSNAFKWQPVPGLLADGAIDCYTWQVEKRGKFSGSVSECIPTAHLDWVQVKLGVTGPKALPCDAYMHIVQFEEDMCPGYWAKQDQISTGTSLDFAGAPSRYESDTANQLDGAASSDEAARWNEFYTGLVDKLISHSFNKRDAYNVRGMKILASQKMSFNPTNSYEIDTRGHKKEFTYFKNFNRLLNYQYENTTGLTVDAAAPQYNVTVNTETDPNVWDSMNVNPGWTSLYESVQCSVEKKARVFLLITAEAMKPGFSDANNASFELMIRRKLTF